MEAHLLSLNNFNRPKVYDADDAAYVHIIYLLMLEPGKFQTHPKMGVGIRSRYRHNNETDFLSSLKSDISNQINKYLPELTAIDITLTLSDHLLGIIIDTTTGTYVLAYDSDKDVIDAAATYVLDDL